MQHHRIATLGLAAALLATAPAAAASLDVTVTNLSHNIYFTPLLVAAHPATSDLFSVGMAASADLQIMAECGDIAALSTTLAGAAADLVANPAAGLLAPGASTTAMLTTASANTRLSVVAMGLPTNDGFVGLDSATIPSAPGTYTFDLNLYDAGTEANDELFSTGCSAGLPGIPADPTMLGGTGGTGVAGADATATVHVHRGTLGDTNATGGASDLDSTVHRWQNPVARVELTVN
ncbi:MAG: spondin domain-containing protein [Nitrospirota bacterium]|nr:spondin domain-containing protein [Nitrospirota bacterium]